MSEPGPKAEEDGAAAQFRFVPQEDIGRHPMLEPNRGTPV